MYTLRTITQNGAITNKYVGDWYLKADKGTERFKEMLAKNMTTLAEAEEANIVGYFGTMSMEIPLYSDEVYYIVNQKGETFERL